MTHENITITLATLFDLIAQRLNEANSVAQAAQGIAPTGNYDSVFRVIDDADQLLYEADRLFSAANIIRREL